MDVVSNSDASRRVKVRTRRMEQVDDNNSCSWGSHSRSSCDLNVNRPEYVNFQGEDIRIPIEPLRSRPPTNQRGVISKEPASYSPPARGGSGQGRFDYYLYHDQGPPRYSMNSYYGEFERVRYPNHDFDVPPNVENLEKNRAELLRKLDELEDQLTRSSDMTEKPNGRTNTDQGMISSATYDPYPRNHAGYGQEGLTSSHCVYKKPLAPDNMASPYLSQAPGFVPFTNRGGPCFSDSYPQRGHPHESLSYANNYQQEMSLRLPHQTQSQYARLPYHEYGYHGDVNHDHFVLHPDGNLFDHNACSCVHCCNRNCYLPPKVDPSGWHNRSQNELSSSDYHHCLYPNRHEPQGNCPDGFNLRTSHSQKSQALISTGVDSESDGYNHNRPRYVLETHREQVWNPIAGGAPIIACCNCFGLLKLPRKHLSMAKTQHKLKCGACASVILFQLGNRGSTVPVSGHVDHVSTGIENASSLIIDENVRYHQHDCSNSADTNAFSNDYDDPEPKVSLSEKKSISGESEKQLDRLSSALCLSDDEQNPETLASGKHGSPSAHVTEVESFPNPGSSDKCLDHCSANIVVNGFDKGNNVKRSDLDQNTPYQNYVADSVMATETDMSLNSCVSKDSAGRSEEHYPMINKAAESFFADDTKSSSRDFTKSTQNLVVNELPVFVNGHLIPDYLVEKAEKLAGPIQPGDYWYDVHAGFWGVMGHPCLGIIMPNIEEFNYPMPENCAAGNTGVFVNGRELHQKDLALLASRGLPAAKHRSYLVEISGEVVDDHTGEELNSLGRLAPTVERAKHGFGMKVPSFLARLQS